MKPKNQEGPLVSISFDDACNNQYRYGLRLMEKHGFQGTLGVVTSRVGQKYSHTPEWHVNAMTWKQIADFSKAGWEIASHSRFHKSIDNEFLRGPYAKLTEKELNSEIIGSKQDPEERGYSPVTFIRPGSFFQNPLIVPEIEMVKKHYLARRLYYSGVYTPAQPLVNNRVFLPPYDLMAIHLISYPELEKDIERLLSWGSKENWIIFCVHGIDEILGGSTTITPQDFSKTLKLLRSFKSAVVTIAEGLSLSEEQASF